MHIVKRLALLCMLILFSLACNAIQNLPILATATPTLSPTPTLTPTPTATPVPTPTPTPLPAVRVAEGDHAITNGDWDTAKAEYQAALGANPEPEIQAAALLGLGQAYYQAGEYSQAELVLQGLMADFPDSLHIPPAYFFLAQTYDAQERYLEAADAYLNYLARRPGLIDSYIHERRGDALFANGNYAEAVADYQAAIRSPRAASGLEVEIKAARAYAFSGDYATAIVGYQDIYNRTADEYIKAQMDLLTGQAYTALGQIDQAHAAYLDAVTNFPRAYDSYTALVALVEAGVPVDEFDRGLVDYYAGEYGVALAAFERYLQVPSADPASGRYHRGLSLRALGGYPDAISEWDWIIENTPDHSLWDEAWEQKAYTQWYFQGDFEAAIQTLLDFVSTVPAHPRAAEFLFDAAGVAERTSEFNRAARFWERMADEYPGSEQAHRALFLAGITRYRQEKYTEAHADFQRLLTLTADLEERSAAFLWSGKCQLALGDAEAARVDWEQAAALDRTGYYSERARDLLREKPPFTPPQEYDFSRDAQAERAEAESWMRTVFALPGEEHLSDTGLLREDPRLQRGAELWQLGLYVEAREEFENLRRSLQDDPTNTYRLFNYLLEIGAYRSAIFAARHVLTLAGMDDAETLSAPVYFNHVRFGTYYRDLVIAAAKAYGFHPLLLFSVIRQESLFESFAGSSAGALGLMQIIPTTGQEVADNAGWPPNYTSQDLYRPLVSISLGSDYLDRQRTFMEGDLYGALAAYNGGPGNASNWKKLAPTDPDLFLEVIRFEETRNYIRGVYEIFNIYRDLYDRTP